MGGVLLMLGSVRRAACDMFLRVRGVWLLLSRWHVPVEDLERPDLDDGCGCVEVWETLSEKRGD